MRDRPEGGAKGGRVPGRLAPALLVALGLFLASGLLPGPDALVAGAGPTGAGATPAGLAASGLAGFRVESAAAWLGPVRGLLQWALEAGLPALSGLPRPGRPASSPAPAAAPSSSATASPAASPMQAGRRWWASLLPGGRLEPRRLLALGFPALGGSQPSTPGSAAPAGPSSPSGSPPATPAPAPGAPAGGQGPSSTGPQTPASTPPPGGVPPGQAAAGSPPPAGGAAPAAPGAGSPTGAAAAASGPVVLVYHTHAREAYGGPGAGQPPDEEGAYSEDPARMVLSAGEALAEELWRTHGIPTLHCEVIHDREGRIGAYLESEATMKRLLGQYRTLRLALDLHRDSQGRSETTVVFAGRPLARVMVVLGQGNPDWESNYSLALQLVELMDDRCPGLSRGIFPKPGRFNQDLLPGSLLLEVGGPENTPAEAAATCEVLAGLFAELVKEHQLPPLSGGVPGRGVGVEGGT